MLPSGCVMAPDFAIFGLDARRLNGLPGKDFRPHVFKQVV